jgi:GTPase SAR1 family protein
LSSLPAWIELFRDNKGEKSVMAVCGNKSDLVK